MDPWLNTFKQGVLKGPIDRIARTRSSRLPRPGPLRGKGSMQTSVVHNMDQIGHVQMSSGLSVDTNEEGE